MRENGFGPCSPLPPQLYRFLHRSLSLFRYLSLFSFLAVLFRTTSLPAFISSAPHPSDLFLIPQARWSPHPITLRYTTSGGIRRAPCKHVNVYFSPPPHNHHSRPHTESFIMLGLTCPCGKCREWRSVSITHTTNIDRTVFPPPPLGAYNGHALISLAAGGRSNAACRGSVGKRARRQISQLNQICM